MQREGEKEQEQRESESGRGMATEYTKDEIDGDYAKQGESKGERVVGVLLGEGGRCRWFSHQVVESFSTGERDAFWSV